MITADRKTVIQILGSLMCQPSFLNDTDKIQIEPNDFSEPLDRYIFSAIYNLYTGGAEKIRTIDVDTYLQSNLSAKKLMEKENGLVFLQDCEAYCEPDNFFYYYNRFKKITLLRELEKSGRSIEQFYCNDPLNPNYNKINNKFEQLTTNDIINSLKGEVASLEDKFTFNSLIEESNAYDGIEELLEQLKIKPDAGLPLQGEIFNTVCRGARLGTVYLRSAPSGMGKTRTMVGDACNLAYPIRYESKYGKWVASGGNEKVLYVMTEQNRDEIQTMILAYLTGISEENFIYGTLNEEEKQRAAIGIQIMKQFKDNLFFIRMPDPCSSLVKNVFRRYNLQKGVSHFFYDYIFSSPAMLNEYRDLGLAEYVCLRLFTTTIKNLAIELNSFILTATQISNDDEKGGFKDHHQIQSSKMIVNLVDLGCIMSRPSVEELKLCTEFKKRYSFTPNCITDIFKNRRGRWTQIRIWSRNDLGTCRRYDLFATDILNKPLEDFQIVDFFTDKTEEQKQLELQYNNGVEIMPSTKHCIEKEEQVGFIMEKILNQSSSIKSSLGIDTNPSFIADAFDNITDKKQRWKGKSLSDLL